MNKIDKYGFSELLYAKFWEEDEDKVKELIKKGASFDKSVRLYLASSDVRIEVLKLYNKFITFDLVYFIKNYSVKYIYDDFIYNDEIISSSEKKECTKIIYSTDLDIKKVVNSILSVLDIKLLHEIIVERKKLIFHSYGYRDINDLESLESYINRLESTELMDYSEKDGIDWDWRKEESSRVKYDIQKLESLDVQLIDLFPTYNDFNEVFQNNDYIKINNYFEIINYFEKKLEILDSAIMQDNSEMILFFLKYTDTVINVNTIFNEETKPYTLLWSAVKNNNIDLAKQLIKNGANVNFIDFEGPLLMFAVLEKNMEMLKLLLQNNANINELSCTGEIALETACDSDNLDIINLLIKNGSKLLDGHFYGEDRTAKEKFISLVVYAQDEKIVKTLLSNIFQLIENEFNMDVLIEILGSEKEDNDTAVIKYFLNNNTEMELFDMFTSEYRKVKDLYYTNHNKYLKILLSLKKEMIDKKVLKYLNEAYKIIENNKGKLIPSIDIDEDEILF